jgi:dimeric dUTPase (all-alpha-NTP-PPase superfamily)
LDCCDDAGDDNSINHFGSESIQATIKRFPCWLFTEFHATIPVLWKPEVFIYVKLLTKIEMNQYQDMLAKIFDEQKKLVEYLGVDRYPKKTEHRISALMTAIIHEAIELQDLTNWKWWKKPSRFEIEMAQTELIDILHFVIQAALELEMTPQKVLEVYMNKNYINRERKKSGY